MPCAQVFVRCKGWGDVGLDCCSVAGPSILWRICRRVPRHCLPFRPFRSVALLVPASLLVSAHLTVRLATSHPLLVNRSLFGSPSCLSVCVSFCLSFQSTGLGSCASVISMCCNGQGSQCSVWVSRQWQRWRGRVLQTSPSPPPAAAASLAVLPAWQRRRPCCRRGCPAVC